MATIMPNMKVGDIVRTWPETMKVFASYNLNLHCGGVHSLTYAADKHGFDLETMLAELNASVAGAAGPNS
jgi:iron-sulfur cluster repair protein YtfE (RIC family)